MSEYYLIRSHEFSPADVAVIGESGMRWHMTGYIQAECDTWNLFPRGAPQYQIEDSPKGAGWKVCRIAAPVEGIYVQ